MTRSILMNFHKYTPFGDEFYEPILDFQIRILSEYQNEFDMVYFIDSNWGIDFLKTAITFPAQIIKVNPSLRYYDAYKQVLPQVKEDLVLFMDNDMVVYKPGKIKEAFDLLTPDEPSWDYDAQISDGYDVVSIIDQIGEYKTDKLRSGNKFCPYFFGTRRDILLKYLDVEWAPNMPEHETLGKLTEKMLEDGVIVYEWEEDKSDILFDGTKNPEVGKNLGYYHIRAGSTPAYLLATKKYGDRKTYDDYLKNQPRSEILRHLAWYYTMCDTNVEGMSIKNDINEMLKDMGVNIFNFQTYWDDFRIYHGLL